MLILASSDAKTLTLHKSTINVDTLLITLYETYEPVCMKQNLELKLHLSEESYPARNNRRICSANGGLPPMIKRRKYYEDLELAA